LEKRYHQETSGKSKPRALGGKGGTNNRSGGGKHSYTFLWGLQQLALGNLVPWAFNIVRSL